MSGKKDVGASGWVDPDDASELTEEFFDRAEIRDGDTVVRRGRGRPKAAETREQIALRLDRALLARYRAGGPGWQTRMHAALALVDRFGDGITKLEMRLAAIPDVRGHADAGGILGNINAEQASRLKIDIVALRRAIENALQANADSSE